MPTYCIVHIDKATRQPIGTPEKIDEPDDDAAINNALQRADGHIVEVWKSNQRIIQFQRGPKR